MCIRDSQSPELRWDQSDSLSRPDGAYDNSKFVHVRADPERKRSAHLPICDEGAFLRRGAASRIFGTLIAHACEARFERSGGSECLKVPAMGMKPGGLPKRDGLIVQETGE